MNRFGKARAFLLGACVVAAGSLLRGALDGPRAPRMQGGQPVRVEVLNGTRVPRAGLALAERLRDAGFDVVDIRNADRADYEKTLVLDRVGEKRWADSVAKRLGAGDPVRQRNDDLLLEVTVILGQDLADRYGGTR
jgi:hypothetical protein